MMMNRSWSCFFGSVLVLANTTMAGASPSSLGKLPKNCQYLKEVATKQTVITKKISSILATNFVRILLSLRVLNFGHLRQ